MLKKCLLFFLIVICVFSLSLVMACNGDDNKLNGGGNSSQSAESANGNSASDGGISIENIDCDNPTQGLWYVLNSENNGYIVRGIGNATGSAIVIPSEYEGLPVVTIGEEAFKNCNAISAIVIPNTVTSMWNSAFAGCRSLSAVLYSGDIADWLGIVFENDCSNPLGAGQNVSLYINKKLVTDVEIPNGVTAINDYAFINYKPLKSVEITSGVKSVGSYAFFRCESLADIVLPSGIESIKEYAFYECVSLKSAVIPNSVTVLGAFVFYGCTALKSVVISNGVTEIKEYTFKNCYSLSSVTIGNSVQSVGESAFYGCRSIVRIVLPHTLTTFGKFAFYDCYKLVEVCSDRLNITKGDKGFGWVGYYAKSIYTNDTTTKLTDDGGFIVYTEGQSKSLVGYFGKEKAIVLPNYITEINQGAFYQDEFVTSVTVPSSVTHIGQSAFNGSSLESLTFGNSVALIDAGAFVGCASLKDVYYLGDLESWCNIDFKNESSPLRNGAKLYIDNQFMSDIVIPEAITSINKNAFNGYVLLNSVVIGNNVTSIGESAFSGCTSLKSVLIESSVESIGDYAFNNCEGLNVYYKGTHEDWGNISMGYKAFLQVDVGQPAKVLIHYYSESYPSDNGFYWHYNRYGEIVVWER